MSISRREFLETTALSGIAMTAAGAEVDKKTGMPMRVLGKTGARVSILAFGSGSRWLAYKEEDKALVVAIGTPHRLHHEMRAVDLVEPVQLVAAEDVEHLGQRDATR